MNQYFKKILILVITILLSLLMSHLCFGCTAFCINKGKQLIVGRNQDWNFGEGMAVINKRGQTKTALSYWGENTSNPVKWVSKYGSVSFVQYGREIAIGGMNEMGLVVNSLQLLSTRYPNADFRASINSDQYVQFILDNYKNTKEIISSDKLIRLRPSSGIHFFAVDRSGSSVVIEFLNGATVVHAQKTMPFKVLANDPYEGSIVFLRKTGLKQIINDFSSLHRFVIASTMVSGYKPSPTAQTVNYALNVLDAVRQGEATKFQIVYDIKNRKIYFKSFANMEFRFFSLSGFDFSAGSVSKVLDLNARVAGDVTARFKDYSTEVNEDLIRKGWYAMGVHTVYMPYLWRISHYPETFSPISAEDARNPTTEGKTWTALIEAAGNGRTEVLKGLIEAGANVNERDDCDETALLEAAGNGFMETAEILIDHKADVNIKNRFYGYSPLMYAARNGMLHTVQRLIEANASIDGTNHEGKTALMMAALEGQTEIVRILIAAGADRTISDKEGKTALMWAKNEGHADIVELLSL